MSASWPSNQSPAWRFAGAALILATLGLTVLFVGRGSSPLKASRDRSLFDSGPRGLRGTLTESFGKGRLVLAYGSIQGQREDLRLEAIQGRLEEDAALWLVNAPRADRKGENWTLSGPLTLEAQGKGDAPLGTGTMPSPGPALRWSAGTWQGLSPLEWTDLAGQGTWSIPAGWSRNPEGELAARGPVRWSPHERGALLGVEARFLRATPGFQAGTLDDVLATFEDGTIQARHSILDPHWIRWPEALSFERSDGWKGRASGGRTPRPQGGQGLQLLELRNFEAERSLAEGSERLRALGARWTPEGLLLEGSVSWEQPLQGINARLVAPRLLMRSAPGGGLPEGLGVGQAWAEGEALLTWGRRSLSSPRIRVDRNRKAWNLDAPVLGRGEEGTFSAGAGRGEGRGWIFEGPVQASLTNGGRLQGQRLVWDEESWLLTGRPVVWTRFRERLSGARVLRKGERVEFPDGLAGQLQAAEGDIALRADWGESQGDRILLRGHVSCEGLGWQVGAETLTVHFGAGRVMKRIQARGGVTLRGRMGEGRGEALDVDPASQEVRWQGRVKGLSEDLAK